MPAKSNKGTALLAVLWLTAALSAIAFSVADTVRAETERSITAQESIRAYFLARGGVERILFAIRNPEGDFGTPEERFQSRRRFYFQDPEGDVLVELISEEGKLPLRSLTPQIFGRLLLTLGESREDAERILQQVFGNYVPGKTFRPSLASMENVEELLLVPGISTELLYGRYSRLPDGRLVNRGGLIDCVSPYITTRTAFDFYSVHSSLLEAMGTPPELARQVTELRRQSFNPAQALATYLQSGLAATVPVGSKLGEAFQIRATGRVRLPNGRLSETRRTVSLLMKYVQQNPRYLWLSPWTHLRWYDQAFSDVAASSAVWSDAKPMERPR